MMKVEKKHITDMENKLSTLSQEITLLKNIIAEMPGFVYWKNIQSEYIGCNRNFAKEAGLTHPSQVIGKKDTAFPWSKLQADAFTAEDKSVVLSRESSIRKDKLPSSTSELGYRYIRTEKKPLTTNKEDVKGVLAIAVDVTQEVLFQKKLQAAKEKALSASQAKSTFIANMSHDIRTPITGILGMADHLLHTANTLRDTCPKQASSALTQLIHTIEQDIPLLKEATHTLLSLCNDILDVVQLESGKTQTHSEDFDIHALVKDAIHLTQPIAKSKQLALSYHIDPHVPRRLNGTRLYLHRTLLNLLGNALKFTEKGYVTLTLTPENNTVTTPKTPITLRITIEDSGKGIPKDKHTLIFERFSRLTPAYNGVYKGTGLGLYTVKQYVNAMNGHIQLESTVGKGSRFTVTLPLHIAQQNKASTPTITHPTPTTPQSKASSPRHTVSLHANTPPPRILVVEDNPMAAIGIQVKLTQLQCHVDIAENGNTAIKMATQQHYDGIFMDIGLPDISGITVAHTLRNNHTQSHHPHTAIIAVTGHADNNKQYQACLQAGMQAVLSKPATQHALTHILQHYILPQTHTTPLPPIIDWENCLQRYQGNTTVVRNLLHTLANQLNDIQPQLAHAYTQQDTETVRRILRQLQSNLCYLTLPDLHYQLNSFYHAIKKRKKSPQHNTYPALQRAITRFLKYEQEKRTPNDACNI